MEWKEERRRKGSRRRRRLEEVEVGRIGGRSGEGKGKREGDECIEGEGREEGKVGIKLVLERK